MLPSRFLAALLLALLVALPASAQQKGEPYSIPAWFKASFLDFREDVAEARGRGRHVLVFFHLDDCPWCARMLKESFEAGPNRDFLEKHFDVVAINVKGAQEVFWSDGSRHTEGGLTSHLKVRGTPTLVFLADDGAIAARVDGYREPQALRKVLEHVQARRYKRQ